MRYRKSILVAAIAIAACGGAKTPDTVPNAARGLRNLGPDSAAVLAIALEASRSLPLGRGPSQPLFAGVYVNGRKSREASDAVARAMGVTQVANVTRRPAVECRAVSSSGQSRPIPCPAGAAASLPPTFSFDEIRATADSAYVGLTETTTTTSKGSCIILRQIGAGWRVMNTMSIADPKRCGR